MPEFGINLEKPRNEAEEERLFFEQGKKGAIDTNGENFLHVSGLVTKYMMENKNEL